MLKIMLFFSPETKFHEFELPESLIQIISESLTLNQWFKFEPGEGIVQLKFLKFSPTAN